MGHTVDKIIHGLHWHQDASSESSITLPNREQTTEPIETSRTAIHTEGDLPDFQSKSSISESTDQVYYSVSTTEPSTSEYEIQSAAPRPTTEKLIPITAIESSTSSSATQPSNAVTTTEPSVSQFYNQSSTSALTAEPSISDTVTSAAGNQVASRMLFYMNHAADACEDFYEYACGEFEANHLISENDLAKQVTRRIFDQADKVSNSVESVEFLHYYNSCMNYESDFDESERLDLAFNAINEIGEFYTEETFAQGDSFDLTTMLSKLFLHNSAPLFDITTELAVKSSLCDEEEKLAPYFILKLGPPVLKNSLFPKDMDECYNKQKSAMKERELNLQQLYKNYASCKSEAEDFIESVERAMQKFPKFERYKDSVKSGVRQILSNFIKTDQDIRKDYITKPFDIPFTITEVQAEMNISFLNWTKLLQNLEVKMHESEQKVRVYQFEKFFKRFKFLEGMNKTLLNNALLGFYVHKIYYELVVPGRDENYCKQIAINQMERHAASLYMSSFSPDKLKEMKSMVTDMFEDLKATLVSGVNNAPKDYYCRGLHPVKTPMKRNNSFWPMLRCIAPRSP